MDTSFPCGLVAVVSQLSLRRRAWRLLLASADARGGGARVESLRTLDRRLTGVTAEPTAGTLGSLAVRWTPPTVLGQAVK